ncbi:CNNM domain-containing protein [Motiliproteus sediminis]|uniref:CNNM domain-containing protein n=1 Tax=Motiliproteus sediminis TaxID=1468178 RepID=UPI001AF01D09|nr:hemolysin family protein [Motiliproteus sediminis]
MTLLIIYISVALGFSFLCSIAEAVILSVTSAHIALMEEQGSGAGRLLKQHKEDINRPLAAILTLNTIAHTVGAAGAGAQAAAVFGDVYVAIASAILTLLILVFSEIIPKTLGAHYWRQLAPATAYGLTGLIWLLYPFVKLSEWLTRGLTAEPTLNGFSREEFKVMAKISAQEGELKRHESRIMQNLLLMRETKARDVMTPRPVIFSLSETLSVGDYFEHHRHQRFSRIPIYNVARDKPTGFVLRADLLQAQAEGNQELPLRRFRRELPGLLAELSLSQAYDELMRHRAHIMLAVDEYGSTQGLLTLEDVLETLLGLEIVDEGDRVTNMQRLARQLWKRRARQMGLDLQHHGDNSNPPT